MPRDPSFQEALLRSPMVGRVWTDCLLRSDRSSELGERDGHALGAGCVDREFVVAAAQVLHDKSAIQRKRILSGVINEYHRAA